ncbi:hypothetical protein DPEC_G00108230 [Dallia pectoralis]|uniref:Uncharacterized protein n=1 Tax=Dallia pectoralis TaxID=75939 RepID=A0ACC2GSK2_DALPE|nr:hypothetical protein DPEC_G00108230 [Dallia pectoralis]
MVHRSGIGVRMQPAFLRLDSVLQTVSVLEAIVQRSFGPDGGQVLFTRDTGQILLTRQGTRILTALRLDHPLLRMVVECVRRHSSVTGDGSKTFILLLASLLREIQRHTRKAPQNAMTGFPMGCSRLLEGQVVHADFSTPLPVHNRGPIKALTVTEPLDPSPFIDGAVLELSGTSGDMEKDLCLFSLLTGSQPVTEWAAIGQEHVATVLFCRSLVLGAQRFVHVGFPKAEGRGQPHSLVVCGLTEGQTEQSVGAVRDALLMLHTAWQPAHRTTVTDVTSRTDLQTDTSTDTSTDQTGAGCVISVGGAFEFLLHHVLLQRPHTDTHTRSHMDIPDVSGMLAEALLSVPRQIYSHISRRYLAAHSHALSSIRNHFASLNGLGTTPSPGAGGTHTGGPESGFGSVDGTVPVGYSSGCSLGVESVSCKYQLILAVLQCLRSVLCVDTVLHTASHKLLHTRADDDE